jgi:signal transduction histidine kinase
MRVNLLSNAVKFTPEEGRIGLEVTGHHDEQTVSFTVWDTGIGIAEADMERLFQPFVQLDSSLARHHPGTGLGLALVARLADLHGGHVTLESTVGEGSRFSITVPWRVNTSP